MNKILKMYEWESRIREVFSMAKICRMTQDEMIQRMQELVFDELNRKQGIKNPKNVYSAYMHGFVEGLIYAGRNDLFRNYLEFCYKVDGILYSTWKDSSHRNTEEFYARQEGNKLADAENHFYWQGTDKIYF
jgi:hypothetical protein